MTRRPTYVNFGKYQPKIDNRPQPDSWTVTCSECDLRAMRFASRHDAQRHYARHQCEQHRLKWLADDRVWLVEQHAPAPERS